MSKLSEAELAKNDSIAGRAVLLLNAVVDDLDALATGISDPDAKAKVFALADDHESNKGKIVADFIVGSPAQPPEEPPKPVAHVTPTVSPEAADHAAQAAVTANARKRVERPVAAKAAKASAKEST